MAGDEAAANEPAEAKRPPERRPRAWRTWQVVLCTVIGLLIGTGIGAAAKKTEPATSTALATAMSTTTKPPVTTRENVGTTTTRASTTTTAATTTTTVAVPGRSRSNPVAMGSDAELLDPPWNVRVLGVTADAADIVRRENQFNKPAEAGHQFFMVNVRLTYRGNDADTPLSVALDSVGTGNVVYATDQASCGVIPKSIENATRVFNGGTVEGNVCWSVKSDDVGSLVMIAHRLFSDRDDRYLSLR